MTAPISNEPTTTRLHHYAGRYCWPGTKLSLQGEKYPAPRHTLTARSGVFFPHHSSRTARCIVGVSAASKNQEAKEKPPLHGDPAPRMKHFPPLHGMDRAIMKFLSPTHTQNAQFPTIFSVLGRYFFHRGTPTTTRCYAGAIFLSCNPSKHPRRGGHRRNRAHLETQSLTTEPKGHGTARPQKSRMQFDWKKFQQRLKTLQFQQSKFIV